MSFKEEKVLILFIVLLAATLRLWGYSRAAVEHFDEGVYASNFWFGEKDDFRYPDRHLYAPPLLPSLIEWSHVFLGTSSLASLLPGLVFGIATIPLIWYFGRQIASPLAGLAAAALLATNESHILYSRTALTEPLLCFWMLLSVCLAYQSLSKISHEDKLTTKIITLAILSGVAAGLAWLSKYNGWLAVAVIVSASIAWAFFNQFSIRKWGSLAIILGIMTTTAFLVWLPYLSSLQKFGGYAAVAGNHQQYFVGVAGWTESLFSQVVKQFQLIGFTTVCGFGIAGTLFWMRYQQPGIASPSEKPPLSFSLANFSLGTWMTASWLIGLSVAIPLYYPYPRLCAPWIIAFCLTIGFMIENFYQFLSAKNESESDEKNESKARTTKQWIVIALLASLCFVSPLRDCFAWFSREGMLRAASLSAIDADRIAGEEGYEQGQVIFYVYGEPALYYHLSAKDYLVGPIGHLDFAKPGASAHLPYPIFLVLGPHAIKSELFAQQWKELGDQFQFIAEYKYTPSLLVQLNEKAAENKENENWTVKLYQLKKPGVKGRQN